MLTVWTSHLKDAEEKANFEREVLSAKRVLERLRDILTSNVQGIERAERSTKAYDSPNWEYRTAHVNGYKGHYEDVMTITNLDQQKKE